MNLSKREILAWASSDVTGQGSQLFASGAVQGSRLQGNVLGGSLKIGAARIVTRVTLGEGKPQVDCVCAVSKRGVCQHAVAVALDWVQRNQPKEESVTFAAERAPTLVQIQKWADETVLRRAQQIVKSADVQEVMFRYPEGRALVLTNRAMLPVSFKMLPNGLAEGKCPCSQSRDYGRLCEHIVAAMLSVMHIYGNDERREMYEAERAHMQRMATASNLIQRSPRGKAAKICVFLPGEAALVDGFYHDEVAIGIRIFVDGVAQKPQALPRVPYAFSEGDEELLETLEDIAEGAIADTLMVSATDCLALLRSSERSWVSVGSARKPLAYQKRAVLTPLHVEPLPEENALKLSVQAPRGMTLLVHGVHGFAVSSTMVVPVAGTLPLPYQMLYREPVLISRDRLVHFYKNELPQLTASLPLDEESVSQDLFTTTPGTPKFALELEGTEIAVMAKLFAQYGNYRVTVGSQEEVSVSDPDDFYHCYVRNREAECAALDRTTEMGFDGRDGANLGSVNGRRAILNLLGEHIPAARRAGWKVRLTGAIETCFENAEMIVPVVSVKATGTNGAFEITTVYEAPQGKLTVGAAEIERALAHRNAYIEKDGQVAFLDIGAIQTLREALASCSARSGETPGSSRIEAVHAPFIEAALSGLEGIDFETHPDWRKRAAAQNRELMPEAVDLGRLEGTLRPYQKQGVYWLRFLETCGFCGILADEMGLGKTLQTLTWLQLPRVREQARRVPSLIICPTSLVENWRREAMKFVPWMRCLVLSGPDRAKLFASVPQQDLVITSYALIRRDAEFHARCKYAAVVLDEAQAIKNQRTQNALAVKQIQADTRLVLSGTPIENGVSDLWSIMDFLMPAYLGKYDDFKVRYEDAVELGGRMAELAQEQLRKKLHPFLLRRIKKDVAPDLPDKIRTVLYCTLTPSQRKVYDQIRDKVRSRMRSLVKEKGLEKSRFEVLADLMRLRQICCDAQLMADYQAKPGEETSAKLDALMELLVEARAGGHRMLVFSQFTSMLKRIAARLEAEGVRYCYLDGSTQNRLERCATFNQDAGIPVFLISLKAGGTGLNLTGADMVVHFDPWWNPAAEEQATDRAHRIGQKKTVQAIKMIAQDTIEEKVLALQQKKQQLIDATVNAGDTAIVSSLTLAEIEDLLA